jgi:hypothetical protein
MTKLLEQAVRRAKSLPDLRQDEVGEIILSLVEQDESEFQLAAEQVAEIRRRMASPEPVVSDMDARAFLKNLL